MDLKKVGMKLFTQSPSEIELTEFIPIFHRWIQQQAVEGVLIDVADYSHVPAGPGITLVTHEGHFSIDEARYRRGLVCYRKNGADEGLAAQLDSLCKAALSACSRLEREPELDGRVKFRGDELHLFANDRLAAPNTETTFEAFEPFLGELLAKLYPRDEYSVAREPDPRERFALTVKTPEPIACDTLLARLSA